MSFRTIENFRLVEWEKLDNLPNNTNSELSNKVDNVIAWQNTTVTRNWNTITVNSLWWPAVVTDWFNRNYFVATEWQTEFTATFNFTENTGSVIVTLNWNVLKPTLDYTEPWLNKIAFVSPLVALDEVQLITGIKWDKWDPWSVDMVIWWTHITVDNTDPNNQVINYDWELFSITLKNKLDWIDDWAEVNNISDTNATDLTDWWDTSLHNHDWRYYTENETDILLSWKLNTSLKWVVNWLAELDALWKVPTSQLPSYVDDVLEFANLASFPVTWETGKIYIAIDTNFSYRWGWSTYIEIADWKAIWWWISWDLSNQTDLQNALNAKATVNTPVVITATASQTVFTVNSYTTNRIQVYVNWLLQTKTTDYTETNSTTITMVTGLTAWDEFKYIIL